MKSLLVAIPLFIAIPVFAKRSNYSMSKISPMEVKSVIESIKKDFPFLNRVPSPLIMAICEVESSFNPNAIGSHGEVGLMQVKPSTANWILGVYNIKGYSGTVSNINNQLLTGMLFLNWLMDKPISYIGVIHSYNVGYAGYKNDNRSNWQYVAKVLEGNIRWIF